jgi:hypothetical protein
MPVSRYGKEHAVIRIWKSGCQDLDLGQGMPGSWSQYCACPDPFRKVHDRIQIWDSTCLDPDLGYYRAMPGCIFETAHARVYMWESVCQDPDPFRDFIPTEFHYACLFSGKFVSFSEYAHTNVHSIDQASIALFIQARFILRFGLFSENQLNYTVWILLFIE